MLEILMRAGCLVAIIGIGYFLRRIHVFKEEDFGVLSKIVLRLTLPAAIITNLSGKQIDLSMLAIALIALFGNLAYVGIGYLIHLRQGKNQQAFGMLNLSGYNIGNFTMPFVQSFWGPLGVITASLYDVGNAFLSLGGAYSLACVVKDNKGVSIKKILKTILSSVAFDCYIIMTILCLANISLPPVVLSLAETIGNANIFMGMLMLGVGFKISGDRKQIGRILKLLSCRYAVAALISLGCFFLLPFPLEVRQTLVIVAFAPIASAASAFTADLGEDVGLASALNSISVVCSVAFVVAFLTFML
ncbi:MAG: AEC family transporter [Lachnospiraceae bacterium]|nr:AEC family transporter [Lachnospiraceae bacterium]